MLQTTIDVYQGYNCTLEAIILIIVLLIFLGAIAYCTIKMFKEK